MFPTNHQWPLKLAAIASELDPRLLSMEKTAQLSDKDTTCKSRDKKLHVCPNVHSDTTGSPSSQYHVDQNNYTNVSKLGSLLTAVFPALSWEPGIADFVIKQIREFYDIPIIVLITKGQKTLFEKNNNVTVVEATKDYDEASLMNKVTEMVRTRYLFIGLSLSHFNNQTSLERLINVLDASEYVKVAGGAARDLKGYWQHGCLQQRMAVYQAKYKMGYYYSKYECMYCDDLLTPFVVYKSLLEDIQFSEGLNGPVLYRDWFAKITLKGHLTMSCPDVMFFMNNHTLMERESWHKIAKKWTLEKIFSYDDKEHKFNCETIGITCRKMISTIKEALLPQCCRTIAGIYISYMDNFAKKNNLSLELFEGSTMSALKMGNMLPWDFDVDTVTRCEDYHTWFNGDYELKELCSYFEHSKGVYFSMTCPFYTIELFCFSPNWTSTQFLPKEYENTPTTIMYSGKEIGVNCNPGRYARNMYGFDNLRHAAHWRTLSMAGTAGKLKGGYANPGTWNPCKVPEFHSCLDHYPGDGNLPFLEPFLNI